MRKQIDQRRPMLETVCQSMRSRAENSGPITDTSGRIQDVLSAIGVGSLLASIANLAERIGRYRLAYAHARLHLHTTEGSAALLLWRRDRATSVHARQRCKG